MLQEFVTFVSMQPWVAILPLVGLGLVDAGLGVALHVLKLHEKFSWQRFADWTENSVGLTTLGAVGLVALVVFLSQGSAAALASLLALGAVSGTAYAKVLADVLSKVRDLIS